MLRFCKYRSPELCAEKTSRKESKNTHKVKKVPKSDPGGKPPELKEKIWENERKALMKRIYFSTTCGKIFYEVFDRSFGCDQKESAYTVDELNMEAFIKQVLKWMKVNRVEDLSHIPFPKKQKE